MEVVRRLENSVSNLFKDLPPIPINFKEFLVKAWPILALIFGLLQLVAAWSLWKLFDLTQPLLDYGELLERYSGVQLGYTAFDKFVIYFGIATLLIEGVIMLMAVSPLQNRLKRGWNLLFIGILINIVYAFISVFIDARGISSFFVGLVSTAIGLYLLFQIRDYYKGSAATPVKKV